MPGALVEPAPAPISPEQRGGRGALGRALIVVALAAAGALAVAFEAPLCPSASLLGVPCPGCGLTRATLALLSLNVRAALALHPLVFVLAPVYFGLLGVAAWSYVRGPSLRPTGERPWHLRRGVTAVAWLLLALVIGVWLARFFGAFGGPVPVRTIAPWASLTR